MPYIYFIDTNNRLRLLFFYFFLSQEQNLYVAWLKIQTKNLYICLSSIPNQLVAI